jgi:hypothetical protein
MYLLPSDIQGVVMDFTSGTRRQWKKRYDLVLRELVTWIRWKMYMLYGLDSIQVEHRK